MLYPTTLFEIENNINTGVELKAEIVDWIEAGYIEGVILPPKQ